MSESIEYGDGIRARLSQLREDVVEKRYSYIKKREGADLLRSSRTCQIEHPSPDVD